MNMQKMLKDMQKVQGKMSRMQADLEQKIFEGEAGGGAVKVSLTGKYDVKAVRLNKSAVDPEDIEALEDLIVAAFHNAKNQIDTEMQATMGSLTQGLKIPGM